MIVKSFLRAVLGNFSSAAPTLVVAFIGSRYLDLNEFGRYVLMLSVVAGLNMCFIGPINQYYQRHCHIENFSSSFFSSTINIYFRLSCLAFFFFLLFFQDLIVAIILTFYFLTINISGLIKNHIQHLQAWHNYLIICGVQGIALILSQLVGLYILPDLIGLLIGGVIGFSVMSITAFWLQSVPPIISSKPLRVFNKAFFSYSAPFLFLSILSWSVSFSDRFIISYYLDEKFVGIYGLLSQFSFVPSMVGGALLTFGVPMLFSRYEKSDVRNSETFRTVLMQGSLCLTMLCSGIAFIPDFFIFFVVGPVLSEFGSIVITVKILLIASFLLAFSNIIGLWYLAEKSTMRLIIPWTMAAVSNIFLCIIFVPIIGISGAALGTLCAYGLLVIYFSVDITKRMKLKRIFQV